MLPPWNDKNKKPAHGVITVSTSFWQFCQKLSFTHRICCLSGISRIYVTVPSF